MTFRPSVAWREIAIHKRGGGNQAPGNMHACLLVCHKEVLDDKGGGLTSAVRVRVQGNRLTFAARIGVGKRYWFRFGQKP